MSQLTEHSLNPRAQHLLKEVVERYIHDGQPVASKTLAEETAIGLSSATIRNVLSDLEERGYLCSPHTSAGRIPTALGYRFFVDRLLTTKPIAQLSLDYFQNQFKEIASVNNVVEKASNLLSELTHFAGLVMLPKRERLIFRHVEFLPLSDNRVLVILVLNQHEVQNRIIYTQRSYSATELQQAANYLTETYSGQDLLKIRRHLLDGLQSDRLQVDRLMQTAVEMADKAFDETKTENDYVMAGHGNLLNLADTTGVDGLRQLFNAFAQKRTILDLLDQCLNAERVQIFIGKEAGEGLLDECSLVTAPYSAGDEIVGALGVIGPARMPYNEVISVVDMTAKLLSTALNSNR